MHERLGTVLLVSWNIGLLLTRDLSDMNWLTIIMMTCLLVQVVILLWDMWKEANVSLALDYMWYHSILHDLFH